MQMAIRLAVLLLAFLRLFKEKYKSAWIIQVALCVLMSSLCYFTNHSYTFFDMFFVAVAFAGKLDYEKIIKIFLGTISLSLIMIFLMNLAGFFPTIHFARSNGSTRFNMGFAHPNTLGQLWMMLCFLYVLLKKGKLKWFDILILVAVGYAIIVFPNSNTSALTVFLLAFVLSCEKIYVRLFHKKLFNKRINKFLVFTFVPAIVIFCFFMLNGYENSKYFSTDVLSTFFARFSIGRQAVKTYGIHLLGNDTIEFYGTASSLLNGSSDKQFFTLDCLYFYFPVVYGVILSAYFVAVSVVSLLKTLKVNDKYMIIIYVLTAIYSICESGLFVMPFSFFYICAQNNRQISRVKR